MGDKLWSQAPLVVAAAWPWSLVEAKFPWIVTSARSVSSEMADSTQIWRRIGAQVRRLTGIRAGHGRLVRSSMTIGSARGEG